jgi:hypothetical protein
MPVTGRAACSDPRNRTSEQSSSTRTEKAKSAQNMHPPRRESAAAVTQQRPGGLKNRAHSAPLVPKNRAEDAENEGAGDMLAAEPGDDDEIAGDPFFQRYNFPQAGAPAAEAESSSVDGSSDTEGPLSPTHMKTRHPPLADALPSPRSPVLSVAVRAPFFYIPVSPFLPTLHADWACDLSREPVIRHRLCKTLT